MDNDLSAVNLNTNNATGLPQGSRAAVNRSMNGREVAPVSKEKAQKLPLTARIAIVAAAALIAMAAPSTLLLLAATKTTVILTGALILVHGVIGTISGICLADMFEETPAEKNAGRMSLRYHREHMESAYARKRLSHQNLLGFHRNMFRHF